MKKKIKLLEPDPRMVREIFYSLRCHPITAKVLANRKLGGLEEVRRFLAPSLGRLRDPFLMTDMHPAVNRIAKAILDREEILIFGDYDVDGVTSTVLMYEFLKSSGAVVSFYIPDRLNEGYGLKAEQAEKLISANPGLGLIITVDCGSHSHDAVKTAGCAGIDVVVTDHHAPPVNLPDAIAVVNPMRDDCKAGLEHLAGVGVAFYLTIAVRKHLREYGYWRRHSEPNLKSLCDLVALGTVADLTPLRDENRILVKTGLEVLQTQNRLGVRSLAKKCGFFKHAFDCEDIAFRIAPRLNAAGRIHHAKLAAMLLMTEQRGKADELANHLEELNCQRRELEKTAFQEVMKRIERESDLLQRKAVVLESSEWHEGVLGIVASRVTEKLLSPVILIAVQDGYGKGSCRSISGFDLLDGLRSCGSLLEDFGGHRMAAGLKIKSSKIDHFRKSFQDVFESKFGRKDPILELPVDCELSFDDVSEILIDELEKLKPFGMKNPEPLFLTRNVQVADSKIVGENHRRMLLTQPSGQTQKILSAIQFCIDPEKPVKEHFDSVVFKLRWNRWNGRKKMQLLVSDMF